MTDPTNSDRHKSKQALLSSLIRLHAEGTILDSETLDMIVKFKMNEISEERLMSFAQQRAASFKFIQ
jgi:hypothetical protein